MQITVQFEAQAKRAAGKRSETLEVQDGASVDSVIRSIAGQADDSLRTLLLTDQQAVQPTLLLFVNDQQIVNPDQVVLQHGSSLTIMPPISGG